MIALASSARFLVCRLHTEAKGLEPEGVALDLLHNVAGQDPAWPDADALGVTEIIGTDVSGPRGTTAAKRGWSS